MNLPNVIAAAKTQPGFWYLATPYAKYAAGHEQAFRDASRVAAALIGAGVPIFCPIAHSHPLSVYGTLPKNDHALWLGIDEHFMKAAAGLIVARMPGWSDSYGVNVEIEHFRKSGKAILYLDNLNEILPSIMPKPTSTAEMPVSLGEFVDANPGVSKRDPAAISAARKNHPLASGVLDYFPDALMEVAAISKAGNDKHNPGQPMHHARGKSTDHADCIMRHLKDRGSLDPEDGLPHSGKVAWRALALLQEELEQQRGLPLPRGAKAPEDDAARKHVEGDQSHTAYDDWYFDSEDRAGA